jgi:hypothetical protein
MIRILRLMEYWYSDAEIAEEDMSHWQVSAIGTSDLGKGKRIKSTILSDLDFGADDEVTQRERATEVFKAARQLANLVACMNESRSHPTAMELARTIAPNDPDVQIAYTEKFGHDDLPDMQ